VQWSKAASGPPDEERNARLWEILGGQRVVLGLGERHILHLLVGLLAGWLMGWLVGVVMGGLVGWLGECSRILIVWQNG
jgi:hypothetical protein